MDRKKLKLIIGIAAIASFVISVILFIVTFAAGFQPPSSVILGIVAALCLVLAAELGYLFLLNKGERANYFLYDSASKRNVSVQKLNFADAILAIGSLRLIVQIQCNVIVAVRLGGGTAISTA